MPVISMKFRLPPQLYVVQIPLPQPKIAVFHKKYSDFSIFLFGFLRFAHLQFMLPVESLLQSAGCNTHEDSPIKYSPKSHSATALRVICSKVCNSAFLYFKLCGFSAGRIPAARYLQTWREGQRHLISALHPSDPC